jgi:hypothetical protein
MFFFYYKRQGTHVYKRNIGALSRNHICLRKVVSITYSERVSVALGNQHAKDMRPITLSSVAYLTYLYLIIFPYYLISGTFFGKRLLNMKCEFYFLHNFVRNMSL